MRIEPTLRALADPTRLRIMRLLSALEAVGVMHRDKMPDYLLDEIVAVVEILEREILK